MAASEAPGFSAASVVEDVLQEHGSRHRGLDLESRRAEEAALRRYEATSWLRKMAGVVAARDLAAEPSEEEFRLGLRSGIILCNVANKIQPGIVPKVVGSSNDPDLVPDGAALSAYQYFENVRNFLVAAQELGLPTFEASDLEQGGISARVVNSVLALKSYYEWKQNGGTGVWKLGGNVKPITTVKQYLPKNSEPFSNSLFRTSSVNGKSLPALTHEDEMNRTQSSGSLSSLVQALLSDKKREEVPQLVESVLSKVVEEFENRLSAQGELVNLSSQTTSEGRKPFSSIPSDNNKVDDGSKVTEKLGCFQNNYNDRQSEQMILKQQMIFNSQGKDLKELKQILSTTKAGIQFMQIKVQEDLNSLGLHINGLAYAASGYHKVLEENRRLYNEVQDLKGSIRVYCRVRPFLNGQVSYLSAIESIEEGDITIKTPSKYGKGQKSFRFNKVFGPTASQAEVFSDMQPLVCSVLDGYNVCIFAYGQTGSGKTYTMSGPRELAEHTMGVNYRSLSDLFYLAEQRKDTFRYDISVQMIEIYNEQVRDLLAADGLLKRLEIRNSSQNGINVPDACLVQVSSTSAVINLMNIGLHNRAMGATALNDRSSRSHSCLTVHVQGRDLTTGAILRGSMHLVDLAGSERVDKSEVTGDRLKEAQHINKSLSALGDVIASLAQKNSHVPYRNSKLTQLLQDSLGGQAKTLMFVHISPEPDAVGETVSTLKFAERVTTVELGAARVNKDGTDVKELKEQIARLKAALARKEGEATSASIERFRAKASVGQSPFHSYQLVEDVDSSSKHRQMAGELSNIKACIKTTPRQRTQSFDLNELRTSPSCPPVNNRPSGNHADSSNDKEADFGEWEDKVMVNKQDQLSLKGENITGSLPDSLYQESLTDELDQLDAVTSDSSEPDLLWRFNHSILPGLPNEAGSKTKKPVAKSARSHGLSLSVSALSPSPSRRVGSQQQRNGRQEQQQQHSSEAKRRSGNRK